MIILVINTLMNGGAEKQAVHLLNLLGKNNDIRLIVINGAQIDKRIYNQIENQQNLILFKQKFLFKKILNLVSIFKSYNNLTVFSYLSLPNLLSVIAGRIAGANNIYSGIRNSKLSILKFLIENFNIIFNSNTIFNCYSGRNNVKFYFTKKKPLVITNVFTNFKQTNKITLNSNLINIITVARFVPQKDYTTALKAVRELKNKCKKFNYTIIGYGQDQELIKKIIHNFGLNNHVQLIINPDNIEHYLDKSHIYLSTSLFEGTSNSIMEAMNYKLPIVATDVGDNYKLVHQNFNGFLTKIGSHIELSQYLFELIKNEKLRQEFGDNSFQILNNNHSSHKFINNYLNLIK